MFSSKLAAAILAVASALKTHEPGMVDVPVFYEFESNHEQDSIRADLKGNWCTGDCMTAFEKQYVETNGESLKAGLEAVRTPGCVPHGQRVVTAGIFRSGSTLLFNVARLWMNLAFPKNVAAGFEGDLDSSVAAVVDKTHDIHPEMEGKYDILLMSRRAVSDSIATRVDTHRAEFDILKVSDEEAFEKVKKECKDLMVQQAAAYKHKKAAYDLLLSDYVENPQREIKEIAKHLGVCPSAYNNDELLKFVQAMGKHLREDPKQDGYITQMHPFMPDDRKQELRPVVQKHINNDPACSKWSSANARVDSNAVYTEWLASESNAGHTHA